MSDELGCPGCMSDDVAADVCDPECLINDDHDHLICRECHYVWTEKGAA